MRCREETLSVLPRLGQKAPACAQALDELLRVLEAVACCYWGCPGKDEPHQIQRIVGRCSSNALAGVELIASGHYDEALGLARNVGEAANLFWLFTLSAGDLKEWKTLQDQDRWNRFRPAKVRQKIEARNVPVPIDVQRYSILSMESAHVGPHTSPQTFNRVVPTLGGFFQEGGFLLALNELAGATAIVGASAVRLIPELEDVNREEVRQAALNVLQAVGGVDVHSIAAIRGDA